MKEIENCLRKTERYILVEEYRGYDPYDGLMSPLFRLPVLRTNKTIRFGFQQIFRRMPINLRPLLGIRKGINPVTFGLCIHAYTYLMKVFPDKKDFYEKEIDILIERLKNLIPAGFESACWGYDFDWESRYASLKAGAPTIVATGIISNALYENWRLAGNRKSAELALESVKFIRKLNKTYSGNDFCWSYSPFDNQKVFNASMKAVRLLVQAYRISGDAGYLDETGNAISYVINNQNADGSWFYSVGDKRNWIDNFHTGYILDCLREYTSATKDADATETMRKGYEYYKENFLHQESTPAGETVIIPKYFNNKIHPVDCTAAAQTILTLTGFGDSVLAERIAHYIISEMLDERGFFYYRKGKFFTNRISYIRWSSAWMFTALSYLLFKQRMN